MSDLWFAEARGEASRYGSMLFRLRSGEVWAVLPLVDRYPRDPVREARELLAHYGGLVHDAGNSLLGVGAKLPPELEPWAFAPDRPAAELGGWEPGLLLVDGATQLSLRQDFGGVRAFATTVAGRHLIVFAPSSITVPELVTGHVDAPRVGYGHYDGGSPE